MRWHCSQALKWKNGNHIEGVIRTAISGLSFGGGGGEGPGNGEGARIWT